MTSTRLSALVLALALAALACTDGTPFEPETCRTEVHVVPGLNGPRGDTVRVEICHTSRNVITRDTLYRGAE